MEVKQQDIIYMWLRDIAASLGIKPKLVKRNGNWAVNILKPGGAPYGEAEWILKAASFHNCWNIFGDGEVYGVNPADPDNLAEAEEFVRKTLEKYP